MSQPQSQPVGSTMPVGASVTPPPGGYMPTGGGGQAAQPDIFSIRQAFQSGDLPALRRAWAYQVGDTGGNQSAPGGPATTGTGSIASTGTQPPPGPGVVSPAAGPAVSAFSPQALSQMAQLYQNPYLGAQMYGNMLNTSMYGPQGNAAWDASRFLNPSTLNQWGFAPPQNPNTGPTQMGPALQSMPSSGAGKPGPSQPNPNYWTGVAQ